MNSPDHGQPTGDPRRRFDCTAATLFVTGLLTLCVFILLGDDPGSRPFQAAAAVLGLQMTAVSALYLARFLRPDWTLRRTRPLAGHFVFLALILVPGLITSVAPLLSLLMAFFLFLVYAVNFASREAFTADSRGFLSPLTVFAAAAASILLLVGGRMLTILLDPSLPSLSEMYLSPRIAHPGRVQGMGQLFAGFLLVLFPLTAAYGAVVRGLRKRLVWLAFALIAAAGILLSFSRAGILALAVQVAAVFAMAGARRQLRVFGAAVIAAAFFVPGLVQRLGTFFSLEHSTNVQRLELWQSALELIRRSPFTGWGLGTFGGLHQALRGEGTPNYYHCHNIYLHIAVECGVPALIVFIAWIARVPRYLKESLTAHPDEPASTRAMRIAGYGILAGLLTFGLFDL